jgi:hypothetical protein
MDKRSRRNYLRALLTGGVAGLAGCSQVPSGPLEGDAGTGTYLDWLPAPDPLSLPDYEVHRFGASDFARHDGALHPATRRLAERRWRPSGTTLLAVLGQPRELFTAFPGTMVFRGLAVDDAVGALRDVGYRSQRTRGDFEIMEWDRLSSDRVHAAELVAVGENAVVAGFRDGAPTEVHAIVDASRGERPRYHERQPSLLEAGMAVGQRTFTSVVTDVENPGALTDVPGQGLAGLDTVAWGWQFDDERARFQAALVFEDEPDARVADVEGTVGGEWLAECRDSSVTREGAVVTVEATIATGRFDFRTAGDPGRDGLPDTAFDVKQDLQEAVLIHAGVDPVPASVLEVVLYTGVRYDREPVQRVPVDGQFADRYDTVQPGDRLAVEPADDGQLAVEWVHPESGDRVPLGNSWYDG